ncbi:hypothetical protein NBRC116188_08220 [Oceaniserpentilla sp. 4NH20-0058]|uniref:hypothetical protein n=1 Tax=Oceaniserpentilla sp. 4NH20-0058 TaxID=3127660 RepID=UPI003109718D
MRNPLFIFLSSLVFLTGCIDIGGDDDEDETSTEYYGYFIDSSVTGLSYSPHDDYEWTQGNGRFFYTPDSSTEFSILGLVLGSATVDSDNPVVTPATLLGEGSLTKDEMATLLAGDTASAQAIKNQLVLLQTLDFDQNTDNGIDLPIPREADAEFLPAKDALSDLDLTLSSSAFASALNDKLELFKTNGTVKQTSVVISEENAVAHFLQTLEDLEALAEYEGRWGMRSGGNGDMSATYIFTGLDIALTEYEGCPGQMYGASIETLKAFCSTPVDIEQTFSTNGTQLILENDDISDTCLTLSANSHEIFASCEFQGSGLGSEIIRLQRAPLAFNNNALHSQYTELVAGDSGTTTFNFDTENNTGSYSSSDESGNITWSFINDGEALQFTTDFDDTTHQFNYKGFVKGSWLANLSGSTAVTNILRNVENTTNATLLKTSGFFGVFDLTPGSATEGECKEVRIGSTINNQNNQITFETYENASGNTYSCDYPTNWGDLEDGVEPTNTETFTITNNYLEATTEGDDRRCYLLGIDDYELDNLYVACETSGNHGVFEIELWRGL